MYIKMCINAFSLNIYNDKHSSLAPVTTSNWKKLQGKLKEDFKKKKKITDLSHFDLSRLSIHLHFLERFFPAFFAPEIF